MAIIKKQQIDGAIVLTAFKAPEPLPPPLPLNLFTQAAPEVIAKATEVVNNELLKIAAFKQVPAVKVQNLFEDALSNSTEPAAPVVQPWEADPKYTILVALAEFAAKKFPKKTLQIIHRTMPTHKYVVKEYDPESGRAKLIGGFKGGTLKPVITERESELYWPKWG